MTNKFGNFSTFFILTDCDFFKNIISEKNFRRSFSDSCRWYAARLAFTYTSAVMSMIGFILGLGDRHGENLLLDLINGDAIHVDFNLLFNKGENLNVPEVRRFP